MSFLLRHILEGSDWRALELAVMRLLEHAGFRDIQDVGGSGEKGADILAVRDSKLTGPKKWLVQVKSVSGNRYIQTPALKQAISGMANYQTDCAVVATNGEFSPRANEFKDHLVSERYNMQLWNGCTLEKLYDEVSLYSPKRSKKGPRGYQSSIIEKVLGNYRSGIPQSFFILATGLGKTFIAAQITDLLYVEGLRKVLVLCHTVDLAEQLQMAFWERIPKTIPTFLFSGGRPPAPREGITFGLYQTFFNYLGGIDSDAYDLVIVDEAHHALANGFASCVNHLNPKHLIGMTATPWRGDGREVEDLFGESLAKVSLVDGMRAGYLARIDYRLMCDNIDWPAIPSLAKKSISVRDLNKRLFLPQRDGSIIEIIQQTTAEIRNPRVAIFSPSRKHASDLASRLCSVGIPSTSVSISDKFVRRRALLDFAAGKYMAITAVDVLNEGIDIPEINIIVFLRATHSRRIFVQQLGRGLRLAPETGKEKVVVLDFVTDLRRLAAVQELDNESKEKIKPGEEEKLYLNESVVKFSDSKAKDFISTWLDDVADLQDTEDSEKLKFPENLI